MNGNGYGFSLIIVIYGAVIYGGGNAQSIVLEPKQFSSIAIS